MNMRSVIFILLTTSISFSAIAASEIKTEPANVDDMGHISVNGKATANDAIAALQNKAGQSGADYFRVNRLTVPGDGSLWSANAILYKR
ncbi:YdgH/BhsA/McbA-like domain containing protein [Enterobacter mori]|uniref:YdgH/BhsA/McbA-like domain containing protein n=1 Tax=Enterobacter mori TaxID=539813 RepID=UPI003B8412B0